MNRSLLIISLLAIALVACGKKEEPVAPAPTESTAPAESATPPADATAPADAAAPAADAAAGAADAAAGAADAAAGAADAAKDAAAGAADAVKADFQKADADSNGVISKTEGETVSGLVEIFDKHDPDKDGTLDLNEFTAAMSEMKK